MPTPRVFVSSTFYDLKYIRANLKYLIESLGYDPVLSEEGNVLYNPEQNVQDACMTEIPNCQMFVLIIGGRSGSNFKDSDKSITNHEFLAAAKSKIPIFALLDRSVSDDHRVFVSNKTNENVDENQISYPSADSVKIFHFIDEVRGQTVNNAIQEFSDFDDIQSYLKLQWAGMMYQFLTTSNEEKRVGSALEALTVATDKIEFYTKAMAKSSTDDMTRLTVEFYDYLMPFRVVQDVTFWGLQLSPQSILGHDSLDSFCDNAIIQHETDDLSITSGGPPYELSKMRLEQNRKQFKEIREHLVTRLAEANISLKEFLAG